MVERKEYLDQLWAWKDEQQIKVVTGIRRCGKSVLLEQYQRRLMAHGVTPDQIISINFENLDYEDSGHMLFWDEADKFNRLVAEFVGTH